MNAKAPKITGIIRAEPCTITGWKLRAPLNAPKEEEAVKPIYIKKEVLAILEKMPIPNLFEGCYLIEITPEEILVYRFAKNLKNEIHTTPDGKGVQSYIPVRHPIKW